MTLLFRGRLLAVLSAGTCMMAGDTKGAEDT
jgi:hypothetical protein